MTISPRKRNPASPIPPSATVLGGANPLLDYLVREVDAPRARQASSAFHRRLNTIATATVSSGNAIATSIASHQYKVTTELQEIRKSLATRLNVASEGNEDDVLSGHQKSCLRGLNQVDQLLLDKAPDDLAQRTRDNNVQLELLQNPNNDLGNAALEGFDRLGKSDDWIALIAPLPFVDSESAELERSRRVRQSEALRAAVVKADF